MNKKKVLLLLTAILLTPRRTRAFDNWKSSEITVAAVLGASVITNLYCLYHIHHQQEIIDTQKSQISISVSQLNEKMSKSFNAITEALRESDHKIETLTKKTAQNNDAIIGKSLVLCTKIVIT